MNSATNCTALRYSTETYCRAQPYDAQNRAKCANAGYSVCAHHPLHRVG
ncbi:MAG TPA: hypothetical protein VFN70_18310 [Burkholderiales bacterium]|nr:hypothetical protein [Burkholderiales bacterium]